MSFDTSTLAEWTKMRDQLLARRTELLAELSAIQAALAPLEAPKSPPSDRRRPPRPNSIAARVESYVREHPNMTVPIVAAALGMAVGPASNALVSLTKRGVLVRYRGAGKHWHYTVAVGAEPAPAPLQDTAAKPLGSPVDASSEKQP